MRYCYHGIWTGLFFVRRNWWDEDHLIKFYDWGRDLWVCRWLMRPIYAWKSLGLWPQGMVAAVVDVAVPFLSFLHSSVAAFLLGSLTFAPRWTTSHYLSLSCTRYSRQLGAIPKDFRVTFSVSLKHFFWSHWKRLHRDCLPQRVSSRSSDLSYGQHGSTKLWLHQDGVDVGKRSLS